MKTFSALLALCESVFFDLHLNKWLNEQPWGWWFETPTWSLWRIVMSDYILHFQWNRVKCHKVSLMITLRSLQRWTDGLVFSCPQVASHYANQVLPNSTGHIYVYGPTQICIPVANALEIPLSCAKPIFKCRKFDMTSATVRSFDTRDLTRL